MFAVKDKKTSYGKQITCPPVQSIWGKFLVMHFEMLFLIPLQRHTCTNQQVSHQAVTQDKHNVHWHCGLRQPLSSSHVTNFAINFSNRHLSLQHSANNVTISRIKRMTCSLVLVQSSYFCAPGVASLEFHTGLWF